MKDQQIDSLIQQEEESKEAESMAYDLAEAKDISHKYDNEWQDKILEMKKWTEKKE